MKNLRILLVENEALEVINLKELLKDLNFELLDVCRSVGSAIESLRRTQPDLILIGTELENGGSGLEVAKHINEYYGTPFMFLISDNDRHLLNQIWETKPAGYLQKPVDKAQLKTALSLSSNWDKKEFVFVKDGYKNVKLYLNDILWIQSEKQYMKFYCADKRVLVRMNTSELLDLFPKGRFIQVHKSYVINLLKVDSFSSKELRIQGQVIPIGRTFKEEVLHHLRSEKVSTH